MMIRKATFSPKRTYRYTLSREWGEGHRCLFIMLNPSIADERKEDPTIRRCIGFARQWGFGSLEICNIFAYRSTDPSALRVEVLRGTDIIGPRNNDAIRSCVAKAKIIVVAWGSHGTILERGSSVKRMIRNLEVHHFGLTKAERQPRHPLYLKKTTPLQIF